MQTGFTTFLNLHATLDTQNQVQKIRIFYKSMLSVFREGDLYRLRITVAEVVWVCVTELHRNYNNPLSLPSPHTHPPELDLPVCSFSIVSADSH